MSTGEKVERPPTIHGLQAVDPAKEATDACVKEVNENLARYNAQVVTTPRFVPDGIGGFRLTIDTVIALR